MKNLTKDKVYDMLEVIKQKKIMVIGDVIRDEYVYGRVDRLSPEAPVPIFIPESKEEKQGGAGNVEMNILALGARCLMVSPNYHQKSVKIRYVAKPYNQQLFRVDYDNLIEIPTDLTMGFVKDLVDSVHAVIIADYNKGTITPDLLAELLPFLKNKKKMVMVDPSVKHFHYYNGVTCLTPNLLEAIYGMGEHSTPIQYNHRDIEMLGGRIMRKLQCNSLLITQGSEGMTLFTCDNTVVSIPTVNQNVFDVTGAGDTVISAFTLAYSCGFTLKESAQFASLAAGIVVGKVGTATASPDELLNAISKEGK